MSVNKLLITALSLVAVAVVADPAPVADLSRSSNQGIQTNGAVRQGSIQDRLQDLERLVEVRGAAQLKLQQELETLLNEVSELRGVTELQTYKLEEILTQQRDIYQEIDRRLGGQPVAAQNVTSSGRPVAATEPEMPAGNPAAVVAADAATTSSPARAAKPTQLSESQAYEQAINYVVKDRDYAAAIPAFEGFIRSYPKSSYTPSSHYWLGQLYYQKNEFKTAKSHFETLVKQYPDNNRVPDALLKLGMVAEKQNDVATAKKHYNQLVKSYPKSKPAVSAKGRLETL